MSTLSFLIIVLLISIQQPPASSATDRRAQEKKESQEKQIRLKTDLVQVRAVVTDKRGQPVAGLKKEDFDLLEDNRPQEISFFSAENVGIRSDPQRQAESKSLREPVDVGRTIVLFVDTVHTSFVNLDRVKRTMRSFVDEQMTDRDMVALVTSSAALGLMEQFTRDRQLLRGAIERLTAWRLSLQESLFTPYLAAQIARGDRRSKILGIEILRQEEMIAKDMRDEIIEPQVRAKARQILAEASYRRTVTLTTLKGVSRANSRNAGPAHDCDLLGRILNVGDRRRSGVHRSATGYQPRRSLRCRQIRRGKKFHAITVRVRNHPEYKIRTQRGYQPLEAKSEEQPLTPRQRLAQAMSAPLPVTTIPVVVSADYFERESLAGQAYIQIYIDASSLRYREQDKHYFFNLDTAITIYDLTGKRVHISTNVANGSFTAERLELAKRNGYRYTERVSLKPGVYQARIGVKETATELVGTATGWIEVPDLDKGRLTLSALMLTRESAETQQPANKAGPVESLSPALTQGIIIYEAGAELAYRLVIYPGKDQKANELSMQIEVAQGDRLIYQGQWGGVESRVVEKDSKGMEVGGSLTLNGVRPGVYELRVAVKSPGVKKPVQRVASFGVEP